MKKQIPILMSTMMVQVELAGRKTMTRRLKGLEAINESPDKWQFSHFEENVKGGLNAVFKAKEEFKRELGHQISIPCPYGKPGDILWVRESFRVNSWCPDDGEMTFRYEADGTLSDRIWIDDEERFAKLWEQSCSQLADAGYEIGPDENYSDYDYKALKLRPNIFMLKDICRIWLEVTDIRVERLQDISEADAVAEGIEPVESLNSGAGISGKQMYKNYHKVGYTEMLPLDSFETLWISINGEESWDANPWVWVVSFRALSTTGKPAELEKEAQCQ